MCTIEDTYLIKIVVSFNSRNRIKYIAEQQSYAFNRMFDRAIIKKLPAYLKFTIVVTSCYIFILPNRMHVTKFDSMLINALERYRNRFNFSFSFKLRNFVSFDRSKYFILCVNLKSFCVLN